MASRPRSVRLWVACCRAASATAAAALAPRSPDRVHPLRRLTYPRRDDRISRVERAVFKYNFAPLAADAADECVTRWRAALAAVGVAAVGLAIVVSWRGRGTR